MSLSQALSTGITGLMSHQKAMDNIGNNLANVNTVGFKKGVYQFATLLEQSLRGGMSADAGTGRGSVNPISMGLGAQTGSINKVFTQGPIENTGNPNDMAIDGNGFFVLRMENGYAYTRAGSFYRGEDGTLMAGDGLYVQGTMAVKNADGSISIPQDAKLQNIVIPIGATGGHSQTTQVQFAGNLDSRQAISYGTRLFGGTSFPSVSNLQKWMQKDFNGGDPIVDSKVDDTWNALERPTFAISQEVRDAYSDALAGAAIPENVNTYARGVVSDVSNPTNRVYHALSVDTATGESRVIDLSDWAASMPVWVQSDPAATPARDVGLDTIEADILAATGQTVRLVPLVQEISTVNGGNVQTSAAYGVKVPEFLSQGTRTGSDGKSYDIRNDFTYPQWFYESTDAAMSYADIVQANNDLAAFLADAANTDAEKSAEADRVIRSIWPDGVNGESWPSSGEVRLGSLPYKDETYPASLNTPLEHLYYLKGNSWVQPFANIKNGDDVGISFKKGDSQIEATFTYNRPQGPDPTNGQVAVDRERSYTLEHFLTFLAGDVDQPSLACQNITPAMFGAPVSEEFPDGNVNAADWDREAYELALENVNLAKQDSNLDSVGGAMGLLSIPPQISDRNNGPDAYDTPVESGGAYSRTGVQDVLYQRWDPEKQKYVDRKYPSFNTSFVSNLGSQNAISDIRVTYNNVPHESMYSAEREYAAAQGGSSVVSVEFYDSLGNPKTATLRMAIVEQNDDFTTWRWYADSTDDTDFQWQADPETGEITTSLNIGTGLIRFDKNGNFVKGAEYSETQGITINQSNQGVNEPILIRILNGLSGSGTQDLDFSELTCSATGSSLKLAKQNGRPPGTLNDFTVGLDGVIQGVYSNGNVVTLARIGLAMIPNESGLIAAGSNLFYTGPASGDARYGHANLGGNGKIRHMQLESSNVDLSEEFTKLITTERGFQANSRTITTADEMITELLNLKR